jgi:hypothetical protein
MSHRQRKGASRHSLEKDWQGVPSEELKELKKSPELLMKNQKVI